MKFDILLAALVEPLSVTISLGDSVVSKRVYRKCPIMLSNRVALVDFVELDIFYFDVILRMDWLYSCFASIVCRTRVVNFEFLNELFIEWKGG